MLENIALMIVIMAISVLTAKWSLKRDAVKQSIELQKRFEV
jgi:hypothetical protein